MRTLILFIAAIINSAYIISQTNLQYQAHVPGTNSGTEVFFSAYIADSTFNEILHLNTNALWYVENARTEVANGIINVTLQNISDEVFNGYNNRNTIYVYGYINGQSIGRLPFYSLPYALYAKSAIHSNVSDSANTATVSAVATYSYSSDHSSTSDSSRFADTSRVSNYSKRSGNADVSVTSQLAIYSVTSDTANFAHVSALSRTAQTVENNGVKLNSLNGSDTAKIGSFLSHGTDNIVWVSNPQYYTQNVSVYTTQPVTLSNTNRYIVSRVTSNYNIVPITNPISGQIITIYNGSTSNRVTLVAVDWNLDTGNDFSILQGVGKTLWFNGTNWVIIN